MFYDYYVGECVLHFSRYVPGITGLLLGRHPYFPRKLFCLEMLLKGNKKYKLQFRYILTALLPFKHRLYLLDPVCKNKMIILS